MAILLSHQHQSASIYTSASASSTCLHIKRKRKHSNCDDYFSDFVRAAGGEKPEVNTLTDGRVENRHMSKGLEIKGLSFLMFFIERNPETVEH